MEPTLIYLVQICDQLKEALGLADDLDVFALIDNETDPRKVQGWCIVRLQEDGRMQQIEDKPYKTIKELLNDYSKED